MIPIILYGKHDSRIVNEICGLLKEYGIIRVSDRRIESLVNSPRFLVVESKSTKVIEIPQGVIVITGKIEADTKLCIKGDFRGVVFSSDKEALKLLKNTDVSVISCGMAEEDTLSLSSIKEDSAVISINRKIKTLNGTFIEPQEHKVILKKPITDYSLLVAYAILLCSTRQETDDTLYNV